MIHYGIHAVPAPGQAAALAGAVGTYQKLLTTHGAKSVQSFVVAAGQDVGSVFHVVAYDTMSEAEKVQDAVRTDPVWQDLQDKTASMVASYSITTLAELE